MVTLHHSVQLTFILMKKWNLNQKHLRSKKGAAKYIKRPCWKDAKLKWAAKGSWFKSFSHDDLTTKHCYFRWSRPPDVDGIKSLIKMTRLQSIKIKEQCFAAWSSLQKFWSHQHQEALSTWKNNVLQWDHHNYNFQTY